jgi:hypothetical protein
VFIQLLHTEGIPGIPRIALYHQLLLLLLLALVM